MAKKVKWGVLSTAEIGMGKVIPAMQKGELVEIAAIASRDGKRAEAAAKKLGIPRAYGSYEALLEDPEIEAIYNPLPNHLHIPWSIKAAEAGKHVLCEKPLAMTARDVEKLIAVRDSTHRKIAEAFMVDAHPQWQKARELARSAEFGELRQIIGYFSYYNRDPKNIRNIKAIGGGGIYDIGTYPIHCARYIFGSEPERVAAAIEYDPDLGIDRLTSVVLKFARGQALFGCSTQIVPFQRMQLLGTRQRVEIEIPFNAPNDRPCRIFVDTGDLSGAGRRSIEFPVCDHYTLQGDAFSRAILEDGEVLVPLENALANMRVIDATFRAGQSGRWERIE